MLYWAVVFLVIAVVAAVLGFGGVAVAAAGIAKLLFFLFLVIFLIMLVLGLMGRQVPRPATSGTASSGHKRSTRLKMHAASRGQLPTPYDDQPFTRLLEAIEPLAGRGSRSDRAQLDRALLVPSLGVRTTAADRESYEFLALPEQHRLAQPLRVDRADFPLHNC